jgi:hypothetical protein
MSFTTFLVGLSLWSFLGNLFSDPKGEELKRLHEHMRQEQATVESLTQQNKALLQEIIQARQEKEQLHRLLAGSVVFAVLLLFLGTAIGSHVKRTALHQLEFKEPRHVYDLS